MSNDIDTTYFQAYPYDTHIVGSSGDERVYFDTLRVARETQYFKKVRSMYLYPIEVFYPKNPDLNSL